MKLIRPLLAAAGFALFGASATLTVFDVFVTLELQRLFPRRPTAKDPGGAPKAVEAPPGTSHP